MKRTLPALLLALFVAHAAAAPAEAQGRRDTQGEAEMLERINGLRAEAGLNPLVRHAALDQAALVHSRDMADTGALAHTSERSGDPADRVAATGVEANRIAQNIALRSSTEGALASILASAPHRAQLLAPGLTHVGLASVRSRRGFYVTQVVAELEGPAALPAPSVRDLRGSRVPAPEPMEGDDEGEEDYADDDADDADDAEDLAEAEEPVYAPSDETPLVRLVPATPTAPAPAPSVSAPEPAPCPLFASPEPAAPAPELAEPAPEPAPERYPEAPAPEAYEPEPPAYASAAPAPVDAGAPTIRLPNGPRAGVAGYWVFHGQRWWFFPVPPGAAAAGAVLQPDLNVSGGPAGYDAYGRPLHQSGAELAPSRRAPFGGWSPRRHPYGR